jgi:hypothetical protein
LKRQIRYGAFPVLIGEISGDGKQDGPFSILQVQFTNYVKKPRMGDRERIVSDQPVKKFDLRQNSEKTKDPIGMINSDRLPYYVAKFHGIAG